MSRFSAGRKRIEHHQDKNGPIRDRITVQRLAEHLNLYSDGKISSYFTLAFRYHKACSFPSAVIYARLFSQIYSYLTSAAKSVLSAHFNPATLDLSFPLSASCTSAIFGHHLQPFVVTKACSHHNTVHMTLMAKRHKSLVAFQWNIHLWCQGWGVGGGGLTCSAQGPEQMWSRTPPPGNWLVQGGLPVIEKRATASEHRQRTAALDPGRW